FHICPSRRNTLLPWYVCKMHRKNVKREEVALNYVRDHNLNTMIFDLYQLENAAESPAVGKRLGHYLDLLLRLNLNTSARPTAIALATENPDETIIRYDGNPLKHGAHNALSWRAFREQHLDAYRASLRRQVATLRGTRSPVLQPWFTTNDDGSMGGNFDFNDLTMARLKADTGLTRDQLPPLKKMPAGNSVFMPDVAPGILPDNHPWLRYFRWHGGHYAVISNAAMEGLQSGWPGCYVQDTGCMAGPLYVPRAYYPPIAFTPLNTAGFYQYLFWFHAYPFAIEAARMGNRDKPVGAVLSASWIDWGGTFQRGTIYRTLAEAPAFLGFWSLDARRHERWEREEESWTEMQRIGEKLKLLAPYVNRQRPRQRHGALFFGLAQNCFNLADKHLRPFEMRSALENFQRAGYKLDLVSTEEAMAGALASYRAVFVAGHEWLTEGAKSELEAFAEHGGALLIDTGTTVPLQGAAQVDGPFGTGLSDVADPICVERCRSAATRALAEEEAAPISPDTIIRVNQLGTGLIAWIIDVETPAELRALQKAQSDDWNSGTHRLLEGWTAETPSVKKKIRVKTPYWAYDLYSGRALPMADDDGSGWREASVDVDAFGASPVALLRDRIAGLEASAATQRVRRGDSAVATFTLTAASGAAIRDPVPATVGVFGPDGNEAWEYGGPTVIDNGLLRVQLPTAVNDAHGQWRTTVRELCSGKTATAQVTVTE
ncbi:MAG: hypothetical protein HON70_24875, partial [Lentisphaerae bacterium]|nr:hypothetical protein [Lentisphaerota bacterium]